MVFAALLFAGVTLQSTLSPEDARLIGLARSAVMGEVLHRPVGMPISRTDPKAVFVTIEIAGKVRGCRGGLVCSTSSLEEEVIRVARSASTHDPRYRPLQPADLKQFKVTVTLVDRCDPIVNVFGITPEDGLVLTRGDRIGVVLPLEGRDPVTRLAWAYRKAGVPDGQPVQLSRMIARRFRG